MNNKRLITDLDTLLKPELLRQSARLLLISLGNSKDPITGETSYHELCYAVAVGMLGVIYELVGSFTDKTVAFAHIAGEINQACAAVFEEVNEITRRHKENGAP